MEKKSVEITVIPQIHIESFPVVKTCRREQFQQIKNTHTHSLTILRSNSHNQTEMVTQVKTMENKPVASEKKA